MKEGLEEELIYVAEILKPRGHRQNIGLDRDTNWIYKAETLRDFNRICSVCECDTDTRGYALNRWFNKTVSLCAEDMFCERDIVKDEGNKYNPSTDFYIDRIPFDLKVSVFPKEFDDIGYCMGHKGDMIERLLNNQSNGGRCKIGNRIYIMCYSQSGNHNATKAKLSLIKREIDKYMEGYNYNKLYKIGDNVYDLIWVYNM